MGGLGGGAVGEARGGVEVEPLEDGAVLPRARLEHLGEGGEGALGGGSRGEGRQGRIGLKSLVGRPDLSESVRCERGRGRQAERGDGGQRGSGPCSHGSQIAEWGARQRERGRKSLGKKPTAQPAFKKNPQRRKSSETATDVAQGSTGLGRLFLRDVGWDEPYLHSAQGKNKAERLSSRCKTKI